MIRITVKKICSCLVVGAISFSVTTAFGQYYDNPGQQLDNKRPLNQLPPVVSAAQASSRPTSPQIIPNVTPQNTNLPPIVSPGSASSTPIVNARPLPANSQTPAAQSQIPAAKTIQTLGPLAPQTLPPITQVPKTQTLPPVSQPRPAFSKPLSSNGVPVYSGNSIPGNSTRPARFRPTAPTSSGPFTIPRIQDGSGTRALPPGGITDLQNSLAPGSIPPPLPEVEIDAPTVVENGVALPPMPESNSPFGGSPIPNSPVSNSPGTNDYFTHPAPAPMGGIDTGCSTCGPGGCYDPAVVQQQNGCCGSVASAGNYLFAEALFWTRNDGDVQLSNSFGLNDFNFVGGGRFTLGMRDNATSGRELTYFGTGNLDESNSATSATGALQPLFSAGSGLSFPQISGFQNATLHRQEKESQLHSLELNKIKWGWDVLKTLVGVRYIYFDDSFEFFSSSASGTNGLFVQDSVNNLFGVHTGFELFYDVGYRTSASVQTKFGAYVNSANVDTSLFNAGAQQLGQEEDDSSIASTIEFNFMSHVQISPRSRLRFGYDLFLGWGLFTVQNNIPRNTFANGFQIGTPVVTSATGTNLNTNNEALFFHGPSIGFEVFR